MTKAYWIGHATVDDPETYAKYREANAVAFAKYHGKFLVRGGAQDLKEGALRPRSVILEFRPSRPRRPVITARNISAPKTCVTQSRLLIL